MKSILVFALALLLQAVKSFPFFGKIGNHLPFCQHPQHYATDLKPYNKDPNFKAQYLSSNWYVSVSQNAFFLKDMKCAQIIVEDFPATLQDAPAKIFGMNEAGNLVAKSFRVDIAQNLVGIPDSEAAFKFGFGAFNPYYYVLDADADFNWILLGEPCKLGYFLLSVTPEISKSILQTVEATLSSLGYKTNSQVERSAQKCPNSLPKAPLIPELAYKVKSESEIITARVTEIKKKDEIRNMKEKELEDLVEAKFAFEVKKKEEAKKKGFPYVPASKSGRQNNIDDAVEKAVLNKVQPSKPKTEPATTQSNSSVPIISASNSLNSSDLSSSVNSSGSAITSLVKDIDDNMKGLNQSTDSSANLSQNTTSSNASGDQITNNHTNASKSGSSNLNSNVSSSSEKQSQNRSNNTQEEKVSDKSESTKISDVNNTTNTTVESNSTSNASNTTNTKSESNVTSLSGDVNNKTNTTSESNDTMNASNTTNTTSQSNDTMNASNTTNTTSESNDTMNASNTTNTTSESNDTMNASNTTNTTSQSNDTMNVSNTTNTTSESNDTMNASNTTNTTSESNSTSLSGNVSNTSNSSTESTSTPASTDISNTSNSSTESTSINNSTASPPESSLPATRRLLIAAYKESHEKSVGQSLSDAKPISPILVKVNLHRSIL
jgi:Lipocalin-like domain